MYSYGYDSLYPYSDYYNYYSSSSGLDTFNTVMAVALIMAAILLAVAAITVTLYVLKGLGLYKLASKRNMKNAFLAFIPFANDYYLGKTADDICLTMNKKNNYAQKILIFNIIWFILYILYLPVFAVSDIMGYGGFALGAFYVVLTLALIAAAVIKSVYEYIALYRIYKEYSFNNAALFEVFSVIFPITVPVFLFVIRNNKSGYEMWLEQRESRRAQEEEEPPAREAFETDTEQEEEPVSYMVAEQTGTEEALPEDAPAEETVPEQDETQTEE